MLFRETSFSISINVLSLTQCILLMDLLAFKMEQQKEQI